MANPPTAPAFTRVLDPADRRALKVRISRGDGDLMLSPGETITGFTLALTAEAELAGMQILTGDGRSPRLTDPDPAVDPELVFWPVITPAMQGAPIFNGGGAALGIELTIDTNSTPPSRTQMTMIVKWAQR
jgi:hypothetical protein